LLEGSIYRTKFSIYRYLNVEMRVRISGKCLGVRELNNATNKDSYFVFIRDAVCKKLLGNYARFLHNRPVTVTIYLTVSEE
jgi:hypothetical protein